MPDDFNVSDDLRRFDLPESSPLVKKVVDMMQSRDLRVLSKDEFLQACEDRLNDASPFPVPPSDYSATDAEFPA